MKKAFLLLALLFCLPGVSFAASIMPDFADVPTGWTTDRYAPATFANIGIYQGRDNVLEIGISRADGLTARPAAYQSMFYNTQGENHELNAGSGSILSAALWISEDWSDAATAGNVRTDMWAVMSDGSAVTDYPIIGFTNYGGAARYRIWDQDTINGWVDINTPVQYDAWNDFAIDFTGSSYIYSINGTTVYTDTTLGGSTKFKGTIMQAYNFFDPALAGANPEQYSVHWSNTVATPEPCTMGLMGLGAAGMAFMRRRARK
ncbi:PEP-CTERM sorting domain-containing protein [Fundidesulfovibrio terrae]|uniref:PEP-CTERM sorting domain-containing protein n=1 Tax=Fundidesulfovibrio terrae TaxID=2922866 RepID=UPI001FB02379|nr:PEP-CTERM sorting domain-containing protein [Fundidesulfovibrio terrae]